MKDDMRYCEKTTSFLRELAMKSEAIAKMYLFDKNHENYPADTSRDLLNEKIFTPVFGTVRKYPGRLLVLLSYTCAANCRYCERQDRVGVGLDREGFLKQDQLDKIIDYIRQDTSLYEIIVSGGDPLTNPRGLEFLFEELRGVSHIKVLRIHTRFPMQHPKNVKIDLMRQLVKSKPTVYLSLHIDHPDELQPEVIEVINCLRDAGYVLLCQTVFLKSINDNVNVLKTLFLKLFQLGVRPYYIYHCQEIPTTKRFVMALNEEVKIMTILREELSGLAFPQHVIDIPFASGKVIVPNNHWNIDLSCVRDFEGEWLNTYTWKKCTK